VAGLITFLGWKIIVLIYPQYNDILQGFTYNGHDYILAFVCISIAIAFLFYSKSKKELLNANHSIVPLFYGLS